MDSEALTFEGVPANRDVRYENAQCVLRITRPVPHLILSRIEGYFTADALAAFDATFRRFASDGVHYAAFHDWWEVTDYVPEARAGLTKLGSDLERVTHGVNILFRSKVIAFSVRVASLVLRNVTAYSDRPSFVKAVHDTLRDGLPR